MNLTRTSLLLGLFILGLFACQEEQISSPANTCKLAIIDRGNGNKHTYTYDASGRISKMTRQFDGSGTGNVLQYVYTFTYTVGGLLASSVWTLDGQPDGAEAYTYTSSQVTKSVQTYADGTTGTNIFNYNPAGLLAEIVSTYTDPANNIKLAMEYNADGIMTRRYHADLQGNKLFEVVLEPVGNAKSAEQLLAAHDLPYDVLTQFPWSVVVGGVGTTDEYFVPDNTGKLVSAGGDLYTAIKVNTKGYITEDTSQDVDTKVLNTEVFTLTDCN